ncbi:spore germination protein, partial [Escherichia coli]|uniref:spore germination protein n=1 Tax=Escherichia coli TaxID=562 RepID=UPI0013C2BA9A
ALTKNAITVGEVKEINDYTTLVTNILSGHAALIIDNEPQAITVSIPGFEKRGVEEPQSATLIKGPRDGFTETLSTNT